MNNTVKARFSVLVIVALILVPWSQIEYEFEAEDKPAISSARDADPWNP